MASNNIIKKLRKEVNREKKMFEFLRQKKKVLPPGFLSIEKGKEEVTYLQRVKIGGKRTAIKLYPNNESDRKVIRELIEKKTVIHGMPVLRRNIEAMMRALECIELYSPLNFQYGEYLGREFYLDGDICLKDWKKIESGNENFHPEGLIFETKSGIMVRSKSEVFIADRLFELGIVFKYEHGIIVGGRRLFPDFELFHPTEKRIMYWEHLGMIDNPSYFLSSINKIDEYGKNGIRVGDNLILTWETKDSPLTKSIIDEQLRFYGLL